MNKDKKINVLESREMVISKANFLVQNSRFKLSVSEQKALAFIISLIKPKKKDTDPDILEYKFKIRDYCDTCGITYGGDNYNYIKSTLKKLSDRSMWLPIGDEEVLCRWLSKARTNKGNGIATIRLDEDMTPFLFNLKEHFTQYQLLDVLPMTSKYSYRLYDILKSYANLKTWIFSADELQDLMDSEYKNNWAKFEDKVLKIAEKEINTYTVLSVRHEVAERGRYNKVTKIKFFIYTKSKNIKSTINDKNHKILENRKVGTDT